jgi:UDP-N-acetylglucosamine diphosphorylase/glucosamine-1-phosphate N-acetyltransferase
LDVVVFEDESCRLFSPLNQLHHTAFLRWGTKPLFDSILHAVHPEGPAELWGRGELEEVTKAAGVRYNEKHGSTTLMVNARARPGKTLSALVSKKSPFVATYGDSIVAARLNPKRVESGLLGKKDAARLSKGEARLSAPPESLFRGYWDLVESNGLAIAEQAQQPADALTLPETAKVVGPPSNIRIHGGAEVEDLVSFDTKSGPIVVCEGASIESFSRISGPAYIGPRVKILSAFIRGGTSIFEGCKVGGEVENSVVMPHSNKAHLGYIGDAYVGEWVNLGAGCTFSNLKNTYGNVRTMAGGKTVDTGMLKLGPAVGGMAKISIGALVFAGKTVGTGSQVTGLSTDDVPPFTYLDGFSGRMVEIRLDSVLETQRRMKERRGLNLSRAEEDLIKFVFRTTSVERRTAGVRKGRIS